MIKITHLNKEYNERKILNDINLVLPRTGLISICGESGCGKTTLLNCISSLLDYEGRIDIDGTIISDLSNKQKDLFRLLNIGFVFQNFRLFENDTVLNNVLFPIEMCSANDRKINKIKALDVLEIVGLKNKGQIKVNRLSGGEKQRVAIARALINNPKVILADEPTGSLDSTNSENIMSVFKSISKKTLVLVVTHDSQLAQKYSDSIIKMRDGKIVGEYHNAEDNKKDNLFINEGTNNFKKPKIPFSFLWRHTLSIWKEKKIRTIIVNGIISLGLIGIGLSVTLSNIISTNIKNVYSSVIDENKIVVQEKESETNNNKYFGSFYEANDLKNKYPKLIDNIGIDYFSDFENLFPNDDSLYLSKDNSKIDGFSSRSINDFDLLKTTHEIFYPKKPSILKNDEIAISISYAGMINLCTHLQIVKTTKGLSDYLLQNDLLVYFHFQNDNWQYDDEQSLKIKAFSISSVNKIYHSNILWNELMFETNMRFPTIDNLNGMKHPWDLRKIYYFYSNEMEKLLIESRFNDDFKCFSLELANNIYFPLLYKNYVSSNIKRCLIFINQKTVLTPNIINHIQEVEPSISSPIFCTNGGYKMLPEYLMMGFSKQSYISFSKQSLEEVVDTASSLSPVENEVVKLPNDVSEAHFSRCFDSGVSFEPIGANSIKGKKPLSTNEIVISKGLLNKLSLGNDINKPLYVSVPKKETILSSGEVLRDYVTLELDICGIINSDSYIIYHDTYWPLIFFQLQVGISVFDLGIKSVCVSLSYNNKSIDKIINKLERAFPTLSFSNPLFSINTGIEQTCQYIEIALFAFSIVATLISIVLLALSNYLYSIENAKEINLTRCIGASKKEAGKLLVFNSFLTCGSSFIIASIELVISTFVICFFLSKSLIATPILVFNPLAFLYMFILAFGISLISSFLISKNTQKGCVLKNL